MEVVSLVREAHIDCMHRIALSDVTTEQAIAIWRAGVAAVGGKTVVRNALRKRSGPPADAVLAVGKAASSMLLGALPFLAPSVRGLLVTKYGHVDPALRHEHTIKSMESGHPVPDENSLMAGHAALRFIASCPPDCRLLVLVSGGASALMEVPVPDMDLTRLQQISQTLLSDGYAIDQINQVRMRLSRVKGGRLLRRFQGQSIQVLGLSDIPGDQAELIGSGVGAVTPPKVTAFAVPPGIQAQMPSVPDDLDRVPEKLSFQFQSQLVGSNALARTAAAQAAEDMGLTVVESGDYLNDNIEKLAPVLAQRLDRGGPGVYLWAANRRSICQKNRVLAAETRVWPWP